MISKNGHMDIGEFERRVRFVSMRAGSRTFKAVRMVMVDGVSRSEAARLLEINPSVVGRGVKLVKNAGAKLEDVRCPNCGESLKI